MGKELPCIIKRGRNGNVRGRCQLKSVMNELCSVMFTYRPLQVSGGAFVVTYSASVGCANLFVAVNETGFGSSAQQVCESVLLQSPCLSKSLRDAGENKAFHRITEWSGLAGTSVGHPAQPPAQAGSPTAGCTAPRPGGA